VDQRGEFIIDEELVELQIFDWVESRDPIDPIG
jgi:hypothetical protein